MARNLRVQYPGAIYHAMNRGDRREAIFSDDRDRECFLDTLAETCQKTDWQVHAWCLMHNHFHLVIETPRANLVEGMKWLLGVYSLRFNRRQKEFGHVFSGRYKALLVDGSSNGYLKTVCDYVHLNPARAKLLTHQQSLHEYPWSSYPWYLKEPGNRPEWLRVDRLLGEWGIAKDSPAGREQFALCLEARRQAEAQPGFDPYKQGWCLGSEAFRAGLLAQVSELAGPLHRGPEVQESVEAKARKIVQEEMQSLGWTCRDLQARRKGDCQKVRIAVRLRRETTMTLAWIAEQLQMGAASHLACLLYRAEKKGSPEENSEDTLF